MARTKYYHADEVAELLGLTTDEVRGMLKRKELKGHKNGRRWFIDMKQPYFENLVCTPPASNENQETFFRYIKDAEHEEIFRKCLYSVKKSIYIATGDFMNVLVDGERLVSILNGMVSKGIKVIVKCMEPHGYEKTEMDFDFFVCSKSHMKVFIFDEKILYIGSANITRAAIARNDESRKAYNHEAGVLTNNTGFIEQALQHFDSVARIENCKTCKKKIRDKCKPL